MGTPVEREGEESCAGLRGDNQERMQRMQITNLGLTCKRAAMSEQETSSTELRQGEKGEGDQYKFDESK